jgi:ribosomal protein L37AE/L43A
MSDDIDVGIDEEEEEKKRRKGVVKSFKEKTPVPSPVDEDETITVKGSDVKKVMEVIPSPQKREAAAYIWELLKRLDRMRKQTETEVNVGDIGFPEEPFKTSVFKKASRMMEDAVAFGLYIKMMQQMGLGNILGTQVEDKSTKELLDRISRLEEQLKKREEESRYEMIRKEMEAMRKEFIENLEKMKPKEESEVVRKLESLESTMKDKRFEEAIERMMEKLTPQNQKSVAEDLVNRLLNTTADLQKEVAQAKSDALKIEIENLRDKLEEVKAIAATDPIDSLKKSLSLWSDMASTIKMAVTGERPDIKERVVEKASESVPDIISTILKIAEAKATTSPNEMKVRCPQCGSEFMIDRNQEIVICPKCGAKLKGPAASQQIPTEQIEKPESEGTE